MLKEGLHGGRVHLKNLTIVYMVVLTSWKFINLYKDLCTFLYACNTLIKGSLEKNIGWIKRCIWKLSRWYIWAITYIEVQARAHFNLSQRVGGFFSLIVFFSLVEILAISSTHPVHLLHHLCSRSFFVWKAAFLISAYWDFLILFSHVSHSWIVWDTISERVVVTSWCIFYRIGLED